MSFNSNFTHNSYNTASTASPNTSVHERIAGGVNDGVNLTNTFINITNNNNDSCSMLNVNTDNAASESSKKKIKTNTSANTSFFSRIPTQRSFTAPEPFPIDVIASQYNESKFYPTGTNTSNTTTNNSNTSENTTLKTSKVNLQTPHPLLRSPERPSPRKARKIFSVSRGLTKAPRLLGRRIKHFFRDDLQVEVHFHQMPTRVITRELATLEILAIYHR